MIKKITLVLVAVASVWLVSCQQSDGRKSRGSRKHERIKNLNAKDSENRSAAFDKAEIEKNFPKGVTPATFPGGLDAMQAYIRKNMQYPEAAKKMKMDGRVIVKAMADKSGNLSGFEVIQSSSAIFNEEALRIVRSMPRFNPAMKDGHAVEDECHIMVPFNGG